MKSVVLIAVALCIPCLAAAGGVYIALKREVKDLESRLELAAGAEEVERPRAPSPQDEPAWVSRLEGRITDLEARIDGLPASGGQPGTPGPSGGPKGGSPPLGQDSLAGENRVGEPAPPRGEGTAPSEKEDLKKKVKELESKLGKVQEKLDKGDKDEDIPYPSFAARLDMDEHQKAATEEILRRGKNELLEHLRKPLPDGKVLIDELAETMYQASKNPEKANKGGEAVFLRLFSEKVPGTQKTFIETIMETQERMKAEVKTHLSDGQKKKYDEWSPDLTKVQLPNDPFGKYIMDYMKRRKEQEGE